MINHTDIIKSKRQFGPHIQNLNPSNWLSILRDTYTIHKYSQTKKGKLKMWILEIDFGIMLVYYDQLYINQLTQPIYLL